MKLIQSFFLLFLLLAQIDLRSQEPLSASKLRLPEKSGQMFKTSPAQVSSPFCQPDTLFHYGGTGNPWQGPNLELLTYDMAGNILSDIFPGRSVTTYTYDANNNRIAELDLRSNWSGGWDSTKILWSYNAYNSPTAQLILMPGNSGWQNHLRYLYYYDANQNLVKELDQVWDGFINWNNKEQWLYTYNSQNIIASLTDQMWVQANSSWMWQDNYRYLYYYDANNKDTCKLLQGILNGSWSNAEKLTWTYDNNNNIATQNEYQYPSGNCTLEDQTVYFYDNSNNLLKANFYAWESNNVWSLRDVCKYTYCSNGCLFTRVYHNIWNNEGGPAPGDSVSSHCGFYTSVAENDTDIEFYLYPNPTNGNFELVLPEGRSYNYSIINILGEQISYGKTTGKRTRFGFSSEPNGIYYLSMCNGMKSFTKKLVLSR